MESVVKIQVCRDPITSVFLGRFGYNLVFIWFIFPVLLLLTSVYYGTLTDIVLPSELSAEGAETLPLLKDRTFYSLLVVVPCVLIVLNYFLRSVPDMFVTLWENKVVRSNIEHGALIGQYNTQLKELEARLS